MSDRREQLSAILKGILGGNHVYYQPPNSLSMKYPAIRYSKSDIESEYANNKKYSNMTRYEIILISDDPDHEAVGKLLELPYSSYDRQYIADNLYHDVITLYY